MASIVLVFAADKPEDGRVTPNMFSCLPWSYRDFWAPFQRSIQILGRARKGGGGGLKCSYNPGIHYDLDLT